MNGKNNKLKLTYNLKTIERKTTEGKCLDTSHQGQTKSYHLQMNLETFCV